MIKNNTLKMLSTLFFVGILASISSVAHSKNSNTKVITLAGIDGYIPFSYAENNQVTGLYTAIVEELFSRTQYRVQIQLMPFKRLISNTKDGYVDGMIGVFSTPEREVFSTYIKETPLAKITSYLFVLKTSDIKYATLDDIAKKVIAHKRGFIMSPELNNAAKNKLFQTQEVKTTQQMVEMLLANRVDGFIQEKANGLYYITKNGKGNLIKMLEPSVSTRRFTYLAFSKKSLVSLPDNFINTISVAFESMVIDGTFKKINDKYHVEF